MAEVSDLDVDAINRAADETDRQSDEASVPPVFRAVTSYLPVVKYGPCKNTFTLARILST